MLRYLQAYGGPLKGSIFVLGGRTLIGRSGEADIQLAELEVSRRHALILEGQDGVLRVGDLSSTNGTWVDGQRVDGQALLPGDLLQLGRSFLMYGEVGKLAELAALEDEADLKLLSGPAEDGTVGLPCIRSLAFWQGATKGKVRGSSSKVSTRPLEVEGEALDETLVTEMSASSLSA